MVKLGVEDCFASGPFSPEFHAAAELIGKRWNGAILWALFHGLNRFSELNSAVPGLSARLLSERLKELEDAGVVWREVTPETPVRVTYRLTPKGDALRAIFKLLNAWALAWPTPEQKPHAPVP